MRLRASPVTREMYCWEVTKPPPSSLDIPGCFVSAVKRPPLPHRLMVFAWKIVELLGSETRPHGRPWGFYCTSASSPASASSFLSYLLLRLPFLHGLNLLKPRAKINLSSQKLVLSGTWPQQGEVTIHRRERKSCSFWCVKTPGVSAGAHTLS